MTITPITAILGASDPEMSAIERIACENGIKYLYAAAQNRRVTAQNAYAADGVLDPDGTHAEIPRGKLLLIECDFSAATAISERAERIDHHRPGDPSYKLPPQDFLLASSLGQTIARTRKMPHPKHYVISQVDNRNVVHIIADFGDAPAVAIPEEYAYIAAADHCLADAYAGRCTGISPSQLAEFRVKQLAREHDRTESAVRFDIELALATLRDAPELLFDGTPVADLGNAPITPEIEEAAARTETTFMSTLLDSNGRQRHILHCATRRLADAWARKACDSGCEVRIIAAAVEALAPLPPNPTHTAELRAYFSL